MTLPLNQIICTDALEGLRKLPDECVDLVVTDPPYFLPTKHYCTRKTFPRSLSDISILEHFFRDVFKECARVVKDTGRVYVFCDGQSYPIFYALLYPHVKQLRPLIWDKVVSINGYSWRHQHEIILFAEMDNAPPVPSGDGDILKYRAVKVDTREHPAEKPVELLLALIKKSSNEGDIGLDPFIGSAPFAIACKQLNRNYIGFDISEEYCKIARKRVASVPERLESFLDAHSKRMNVERVSAARERDRELFGGR